MNNSNNFRTFDGYYIMDRNAIMDRNQYLITTHTAITVPFGGGGFDALGFLGAWECSVYFSSGPQGRAALRKPSGILVVFGVGGEWFWDVVAPCPLARP